MLFYGIFDYIEYLLCINYVVTGWQVVTFPHSSCCFFQLQVLCWSAYCKRPHILISFSSSFLLTMMTLFILWNWQNVPSLLWDAFCLSILLSVCLSWWGSCQRHLFQPRHIPAPLRDSWVPPDRVWYSPICVSRVGQASALWNLFSAAPMQAS